MERATTNSKLRSKQGPEQLVVGRVNAGVTSRSCEEGWPSRFQAPLRPALTPSDDEQHCATDVHSQRARALLPRTAPVRGQGTWVHSHGLHCPHTPSPAVQVLKAEHFDESNTTTGIVGPHYRVHYKGWKQTWDEWVPPARLVKWTDTNLTLQKNLQAQTPGAAATKPKEHKGQPKVQRKDTATTARGLKRGRAEVRAPSLFFVRLA